DDGEDVYLRDGLVRAIEMLGKPGIERLLGLAESGSEKDLIKVVEAFAGLRTRPAAEAVPGLLRNPHVSIIQRAALVRSYGNYLPAPPPDLAPALKYLTDHPEEPAVVQLAGVEVLSLSGLLREEKGQKWLLGLLDGKDANLRLAAVKAVEDN